MKKNIWIFLFFLALAVDLLAIYLKNEVIRYFSKPLIIIFLIGYFASQLSNIESSLKKWVISALIFSCLGDILLLFEPGDSRFFLFGLSAFLMANIIYIFFFHQVRIIENIRGKTWLLLPVAVYYAFIITWLSPFLGDMKIPVRIYAVVISFMFMLALHMLFIPNKKAGLTMAGGASLFILSDSILAVNKFYGSFEFAGIAVMLTYAFAQFLIVKGTIDYIRS